MSAPSNLFRIKPTDAAWLAGLFEGEGCIYTSKHRPGPTRIYAYPQLKISMTDRDVIERCFTLTGLGTFGGMQVPPSRQGHKPSWYWQVNRRDELLTVIGMIWPYLGERRKAKTREVLLAWRDGAHRMPAITSLQIRCSA